MNAATQYSRKSVSMLSLAIIILLLLSIAGVGDTSQQPAYAQDNPTAIVIPAEITPTISAMPAEAAFEENKGQFQEGIQYVVSTGAYDAGLTKEGVVFKVMQPVDPSAFQPHPPLGTGGSIRGTATAAAQGTPASATEPTITFDEFRFSFNGLDTKAEFSPEEPQITTSNYIYGNPPQSIVDVKQYARVRYKGIYQGIDVLYYVTQKVLHYEFYIEPNADVNQIGLHFDDTTTLKIESDGSLVIGFGDKANAREMRKSAPIAYQIIDDQRIAVDAHYVIDGNDLTFALGDYDQSRLLIIDPFFTYAGFVGCNRADSVSDVAR